MLRRHDSAPDPNRIRHNQDDASDATPPLFTPQKLYDPLGGFPSKLPVSGGNRCPFFHRGGSGASNRFEFLFNHFRGFNADAGPLAHGGTERRNGVNSRNHMQSQMTCMISKSAVSPPMV